jgi:hypothetical protein
MTRALAEFKHLSQTIPPSVLLGYHFCYGDLAHHHLVEPESLALSVEMANLAITNSGRRVNWVHMPVPIERSDEAYFTPLRDLKHDATKVFLGLIHRHDGVDGALTRARVAKRYLPSFGVATECGLGRREPQTLNELLRIHREVADRLATS